jgi:serine/threonine protein kinase
MPLVPGTKLGPYEIGALLGTGGMGEVYRARDTRLERTVAIKILPEQLSNDPVRKQRFEREAKTISCLNHPHICVLHGVGSQDGISLPRDGVRRRGNAGKAQGTPLSERTLCGRPRSGFCVAGPQLCITVLFAESYRLNSLELCRIAYDTSNPTQELRTAAALEKA